MSTSSNGSSSGKNGVSSTAALAAGADNPSAAQDGEESENDSSPGKQAVALPDFIALLPDHIWYLTSSGQEMWCRRPYGFFFSTSEAAVAFAAQVGSAFDLTPIGVSSKELVSQQGIDAMRQLGVHRLFIDPRIEPTSGDVFGRILRIEPRQ
jgi:hypothetical protein